MFDGEADRNDGSITAHRANFKIISRSLSDRSMLLAGTMMNADQKRTSFSATPVFAELTQAANELEEERQYSILADGIQQRSVFSFVAVRVSIASAPNSRA